MRRWVTWTGQFHEKQAAPLTPLLIDEAIRAAGDPETLWDQKGRVWSRWQTCVPGDYRTCARCGARIDQGLVLQPELRVTICRQHVRRWV